MRVLITGGTSLLAVAVAERLVARGDQVTALQRGQTDRPVAEGVRGVMGDITDAEAVADAVAGHDAVIHAAAKVDVVGDFSLFEQVNVGGTRHVLDACKAHDVGTLVHVSTPSVAHQGRSLVAAPAGVADPATARGAYAVTKAVAERLVLDRPADNTTTAVLRPHLVWGPGDTQLVGRMVDRARQGRVATIGTGMALIDSTFVDDAADAIVAGLDRAEHADREPLVVSGGQPRPVAELIDGILRAHGLRLPPNRRVPAGVARVAGRGIERLWNERGWSEPPMTEFLAEQLSTAHWFDQRRTWEALDWRPRVGVAEGLRRLVS